jgi:hypothetical protein
MHYFYSLIFSIFTAFACAHYAKRRGRNPFYWFMGGVFFGIFALITLILLPRKAQCVIASVPVAAPPPVRLQALAETQTKKFWYYLDAERQQSGPMSFEALGKAWTDGRVNGSSLVWNEELETWKRFEEVVSVM